MEIKVEHVYKAFDDKPVLTDVSLEFKSGGIYCLMGPSGQGKTTLLRLLMGLEAADTGRILYGGVPLHFQKNIKRYGLGRCRLADQTPMAFGAVFQEDRLCEWLDAVHNVAMVPMGEDTGNSGRTGKQMDVSRARILLSQLLPEESLDQPVRALSGGMKRRVAIARAVAARTPVLMMDEPFTGLDEDTKTKVIGFLLRERRERTLIVVTHQTEDARQLGAQVIRI